MNKDHVLGIAKTIAGHIMEVTGKAVRDPQIVAEGKAMRLAGKAQHAVASTRDEIRRLGR